jgi:hypothetical protein
MPDDEDHDATTASPLAPESPSSGSGESSSGEEEFKIHVRKLDAPVRPRGVLAE